MATAAFLTRDSYLGETSRPLTLNRYGYCLGNPVCYVDPSGHITLDELSDMLEMAGESYDSFMRGTAAAIVRDGMVLSETLLVPVDWIDHAFSGNVHGISESVAHVRQREEEWIADAAEKAQDMSAFYAGTCAGDAITLYFLWGSMGNPSDMNGGGSYAQKAYLQTAEGVVVEVEIESSGTVVGVLSGVPSTGVPGTIRNMEKEHEKTAAGNRDGSIKNGGRPKGDREADEYYKKGLQEVPDEWIEVEGPEELRIKSESFKNFLKEQGYNPNSWSKVVEKWASPDGTIYQRNYWTNGIDYYYHGEGIEEFFPH